MHGEVSSLALRIHELLVYWCWLWQFLRHMLRPFHYNSNHTNQFLFTLKTLFCFQYKNWSQTFERNNYEFQCEQCLKPLDLFQCIAHCFNLKQVLIVMLLLHSQCLYLFHLIISFHLFNNYTTFCNKKTV